MPDNTVLLALDDVTIRVRDKHILEHTSWTIKQGEHWAVLGPNGSGKSSLVRAFIDEYTVVAGRVKRDPRVLQPEGIGYVSFEQQLDLYTHAERNRRSFSFSGKPENSLTVTEVVNGTTEIARTLELEHLLLRPIITLSTGEIRRALIARALAKRPEVLILDEPFEGLDRGGREQLDRILSAAVRRRPVTVLLATHRLDHLVEELTHVICLKQCTVIAQGGRSEVFSSPQFASLYSDETESTEWRGGLKSPYNHSPAEAQNGTMRKDSGPNTPVVSMDRVTVSFNNHTIIKDFSWDVYLGENWIITGPNGSGKSTLFRLITGDNSQVYANNISLFGRRRGTGDNLREIRTRFGFLSTELHMGYRGDVPAIETVLSGFFDSIGLFSAPDADRKLEAEKWIERIGLEGREQDHFSWFSYGEQRLILLARALIKGPELLLLDEPLQGLDPHNRKRFLSVLAGEAASVGRSILLITHYEEEVLELCPGIFTKRLRL